jgi:hypothetical protein
VSPNKAAPPKSGTREQLRWAGWCKDSIDMAIMRATPHEVTDAEKARWEKCQATSTEELMKGCVTILRGEQ